MLLVLFQSLWQYYNVSYLYSADTRRHVDWRDIISLARGYTLNPYYLIFSGLFYQKTLLCFE
jgi:hypothetical protein